MGPQTEMERCVLTVVLRFADSHYGVGVGEMCRSLPMDRLVRLERAPHPILQGTVGFNGTIVPVFDARSILGHPAAPETDESRVVVLRAGERRFGISVDSVTGLISTPAKRFRRVDGPGLVRSVARNKWQVSLLDIGQLRRLIQRRLGAWPSADMLNRSVEYSSLATAVTV